MDELAKVPLRIHWAVALLDLAPAERVLELGCGPGVAAGLVAERLVKGTITAIDRSATAVARTRLRNADHIESGRMQVQQVALADLRTDRRFDKAFGVNVNVFWTTPAEAECGVLSDVLVGGGVVHLVYDAPADPGRIITGAAASLSRHGFSVSTAAGPSRSLVGITGLRRG